MASAYKGYEILQICTQKNNLCVCAHVTESDRHTNREDCCEFPEVIGLIPLAVLAMLPRASSGNSGKYGCRFIGW